VRRSQSHPQAEHEYSSDLDPGCLRFGFRNLARSPDGRQDNGFGARMLKREDCHRHPVLQLVTKPPPSIRVPLD